jgi:hypothetical protein
MPSARAPYEEMRGLWVKSRVEMVQFPPGASEGTSERAKDQVPLSTPNLVSEFLSVNLKKSLHHPPVFQQSP